MVKFARCFVVLLFAIGLIGCAEKKSRPPPMSSSVPMMKEDPRSITSVEGVIQEADSHHLVVFTTKQVTLKFERDDKTVVNPPGAKVSSGMNVKIDIEHLARGMRAKGVEVLPSHP